VAYKCDDKHSFTWFIHSSGHGFKMEIPFAWIETTEFAQSQTQADQACAVFILSQPPNFFMEALDTSGPSPAREWKKCSDWTEGMQASNVLRHELVGATVLLLHALRGLPGGPSPTPQLIAPHGFSRSPSNTLSGMQMQIPQPPMMAIPPTPASTSFLSNPTMHHLQMTHGRKRSFSGPAAFHNPLSQSDISSPLNDAHSQNAAVDPGTHSQSNFISPPQRPTSLDFYSPTFLDTSFTSYQMSTPGSPSRQGPPPTLGDFTSVPISHVAPRSFAPRMGAFSNELRIPSARRYSELPQPTSSAFSTLASSPLLATAYSPNEPRIMEGTMPSVLNSLDMGNYQYGDASSESPPRPVRVSPPMSDRSSSLHGALDATAVGLGKSQQ
jgi:regulatory protein PHO2